MRPWSTERPWAILVLKEGTIKIDNKWVPNDTIEEIVGPLESLEAVNAWITAHPDLEADYTLVAQPLQNPAN